MEVSGVSVRGRMMNVAGLVDQISSELEAMSRDIARAGLGEIEEFAAETSVLVAG